MTRYTVLGATGFIGSHLVRRLRAAGADVQAPARGKRLGEGELGIVFYCAGLTADFRTRPFETVEAHVELLSRVLRRTDFVSLVYLSSTRIYRRVAGLAREDSPVPMVPGDPDDLYSLSKALGESLGVSSGMPFKVARLSNVYGPDFSSHNFLGSLVQAAVSQGSIVLETAPESRRDYLAVDEAVDLLVRIGGESRHTVYNVASGQLVRSSDVVERVRQLTGCDVRVTPGAPTFDSPPIDTMRIRHEFGFIPRGVLTDLEWLVDAYRQHAEEKR